jgi:hypothetical protein
MKTINEKLVNIQGRLKAPKNQRNSFGNYNYRSCEDILEAVKPLLSEHNLTLILRDETLKVGDIYFIESFAILSDGGSKIESFAQAGINLNKKGMDIAQSFGASSSYARKYALNGLFLIDDTKDADSTNDHGKSDGGLKEVKSDDSENKPWLNKSTPQFDNAKKALKEGKVSLVDLRNHYKVSNEVAKLLQE